jgi:hypothetical protein
MKNIEEFYQLFEINEHNANYNPMGYFRIVRS